MYTIHFLCKPGEYDAEFRRLNALIEAAAELQPGYRGSESWYSKSGEEVNAIYYWDNLESLNTFALGTSKLKSNIKNGMRATMYI